MFTEDGQYRLVRDEGSIRTKAEGQALRDLSESLEAPQMANPEDILIQEFNVTIPKGTTSWSVEKACTASTYELNSTALKVNKATWRKNWDAMSEQVQLLNAKCQIIAQNPNFRPNSPKDCIEIFFNKRKHPIQRTTPKGTPSMDKETLATIASFGDDLAESVIEARESISKLSQLTAWEGYAITGKVQAHWNQNGTPMARYACDEPNLQNRITEIRETIEAPEGYQLLSLDLGQAEYVTWASLSGDELLQSVFKEGKDLHLTMIEEVLKVVDLPLKEEPRKAGKTINFALLYLMQPFSLAKKLNCSVVTADAIIAAYRQRAPKAVKYMEDYIAAAKVKGQTTTQFGRIRVMPGYQNAKGAMKHEMDKTVWHHHNAGTAAELLKIKQVRSVNALRKLGIPQEQARLGLQMHDELIWVVREDVLDQVKAVTLEQFQRPIAGFLDFKIDQRTGPNWLSISK